MKSETAMNDTLSAVAKAVAEEQITRQGKKEWAQSTHAACLCRLVAALFGAEMTDPRILRLFDLLTEKGIGMANPSQFRQWLEHKDRAVLPKPEPGKSAIAADLL